MTTELTAKEQAAINFLARNNGAGATTKSYLKDDNCSWFGIRDLMAGLTLTRHEAAGIMSALDRKGMIFDHEGGTDPRSESWYVTNAGIDASDLAD